MATLCLDSSVEHHPEFELRHWLAGNWALLFSNPEDFGPPFRKRGRWLDGLRSDFQARALRAVRVQVDGPSQSSWIDELHLDQQTLWLSEPAGAEDVVSPATGSLREALLSLRTRFVLFVDEDLRRREVLQYSAGRDSISISDLLFSVDALRAHQFAGSAARSIHARTESLTR